MANFKNEAFEAKWNEVKTAFNELTSMDIFPIYIKDGEAVQEITTISLNEQLKSWHDDVFTIAVCGQVKAGKSTLLNSLFFGDDVLPVFDTPMTAKLTFITYGEKEGFEVKFYSEKEWDEILNNKNDEEGVKQLNSRIQECAENFGNYARDFIGTPPIKVMGDLSKLNEYVSVPKVGDKSKCGQFTPFVKEVTIFEPDEGLKNLQIVDTPGLNDSNVINSRQTTQWINKAHAVVYVLDVTGAHEPDIEFFINFFPSSASASRIFVQNKIDMEEDAYKARQNIESYGNNKVYKDLGLFGENEVICSYSGLLALRQSKIDAGKTPSEQEEFAYNFDWIEEDFNPDPDNLKEKISEVLCKYEGNTRIQRAVGRFIQILEAKKEYFLDQKVLKEDQALACDMDLKELDKKIDKLNEFRKKIDVKSKDLKHETQGKLGEFIFDLKSDCSDANVRILNGIEVELNAMTRTDQVKAKIPLLLMNNVRKEYSLLTKEISKTEKKIYRYFDEQKEEFEDLAREYGLFEELSRASFTTASLDSKLQPVLEELNKFSNDLDRVLPNSFTDLFTFMDTIRDDTTKILSASLQSLYKKFEGVTGSLEKDTLLQIDYYVGNIASWADKQVEMLKTVKQQKSSNENKKQECINMANELQNSANLVTNKIEQFSKLKSKFDNELIIEQIIENCQKKFGNNFTKDLKQKVLSLTIKSNKDKNKFIEIISLADTVEMAINKMVQL